MTCRTITTLASLRAEDGDLESQPPADMVMREELSRPDAPQTNLGPRGGLRWAGVVCSDEGDTGSHSLHLKIAEERAQEAFGVDRCLGSGRPKRVSS